MKPPVLDMMRVATNITGLLVLLLVVVQAVTGILLGFFYAPSQAPARWVDGRLATILVNERVVQVGPFKDTVGATATPALGPAGKFDAVPSEAAASVGVTIANAHLGTVIRNIHHTNTGWLYALGLLWVVLLFIVRAYVTDRFTWVRAILLIILVLAGAWSGRLLPDDVYAEISRRIVGHQLQEAPFGTFIASLFGVSPGDAHLPRTFFLHVLIGVGSLLLLVVCGGIVWRGLARNIIVVAMAVVVVALSSTNRPDYSPVRDAIRGLDGTAHADPWWVVSPLYTVVGWFGAELTGYLLIGVVVGLLVLVIPRHSPYWRR